MCVAGSVLAMGVAGPAVASSAHPAMPAPGWRVVKTFAGGCGDVKAVTATGPNGAWATGDWRPCDGGLPVPLIGRWDGFSWQRLRPPSHFGSLASLGFIGTAVAALSSTYAWTFVQGGDESFAVLWNSGRWRAYRLTRTTTTFTSAVVFSRTNAWVFGRAGHNGQGFALRFNGRAWRQVPIPVMPIAAAEPQPSNMWVVGTARPGFGGRRMLAHWTGGRWRTIPFPNLNVPSFDVFPRSIVWDNNNGAWVSGDTAPSDSAPTGQLLHWTGKVWVDVVAPFQADGLEPLAHDGQGGLWMTVAQNCGDRCQYQEMANYSASGVWSQTAVEARYVDVLAMRLIPGTTSVWAGGIAGQGTDSAVILKFGF
jgi:hypothetical protein